MNAAYAWQRRVPHTASTRRRIVAFAIDSIIVFVLAWICAFVAQATGVLRIPDVEILGQTSPVAGLLWVVSIFELPILLVYTTLFEGYGARTPGKLLTGLRVARIDGDAPTLADAFLRNLLRLLWVTPFGVAFLLLDAWSLRITELDQRMGDLAAGTVVLGPERL